MKLFVVGESSPNPEDWSTWSEFSLVIAETAEQAVALTEGCGPAKVAEVDTTQARVLVTMPEPAWGQDA